MTRKMVYEGPDLQQLLQRVIDERGPARIRPPERRRKGGLFGFFAREVYVITVDESEPASAGAAAQAAAPTVAGAAGVAGAAEAGDGDTVGAGAARLAALAASGDGDRAKVPASVATAAASRPSRAAGNTPARVSALSSRSGVVSTPLRALVESTEDEADLSTGSSNGDAGGRTNGAAGGRTNGAAGGRTNGVANGLVDASRRQETVRAPRPAPVVHKPFRDVLSEVASSLGEEPGSYRPDPEMLRRPRPPGATTSPGSPGPARVAPAGSGADGKSARPGSRPLRKEDLATAPAQLSLIDLHEQTPPAAAQPVDEVAEAQPVDEPMNEAAAQPVDEVADETEADGGHDESADLDATIVHLLRAAGFPDDLLPHTALDPDRPMLEAVFASLPGPPPLPADPGGLVAVVGCAGMVRPLANAVALAVDCPEEEVVVASPSASDRHARAQYRARTAAQASALHSGWRRDKVAVVAVYAPPMGTTQSWTREVLHALRPSCVWGMAGATTKPDDVRRWVGAIGGVDALAVTEVDSTATPASILSLGIPVACLDEEPATPERWAATVAELITKH